ncbi:alpha-1,4-glucan--maltose-1-phosphate maltosyltransferase [Microlunatus soli]|uniref:alpha-1,4-glucan--maltose-1-phosphate maltosyltransferase n=1 Tax=Microlunatus soli TaxID=630515 RepID=UPI001E6557A8|nr:alpha-1,4-glucan--maltose-1-phosphate maltosyltransferase [Microlunatus soli]
MTPRDLVPVGTSFPRIPVLKPSPVIDDGTLPAKAAIGELFTVAATVFREGHDAVGAQAVLTDPDGASRTVPLHPIQPAGFDRWGADVALDRLGGWTFRVEAFDDPFETWRHHAEIKIPAGIDVQLVCAEGRQLFEEAAQTAAAAGDQAAVSALAAAAESLAAPEQVEDRLSHALSAGVLAAADRFKPRRLLSSTREYPIFCDRRRALFSSWYEFFPRSQGAVRDERSGAWSSGTFRSSIERLDAAARMGFDVVYIPPIHPIGTSFRKGPNNTLEPGPYDPGSPWAIGSPEGGHDAIHPDLGTVDDFDDFVAHARSLGLEIAMDFALQASPDHPWVTEHPEWFSTRIDGSIAYAENPPKKYQDIYPINFDNDRDGIYAECLRLINFWISHGVTIFRVDNPHTKPVDFWAWLLAEVRRSNPEVIFLAEAFTRPEMMHTLGKVGFHQSYSYFTWRNEKSEIIDYITELSTETDAFLRPNFFVNTPDILPTFLQSGLASAFTIRAVLGATLSSNWGVYSGFELLEHEPLRPGGEEYLDSEKYQYRPRDFAAADADGSSLSLLLGVLNQLRHDHPALQQLRKVHFHTAPHDQVLAYSKKVGDDVVIVICSLDPHQTVETEVTLDLPAIGLDDHEVFGVHDELTDQTWRWGQRNYVRLTPDNPAHILTLRPLPTTPIASTAEQAPTTTEPAPSTAEQETAAARASEPAPRSGAAAVPTEAS